MSISVITSRFVRLVYKLNFFSLIIPREHLKSGMMAVANFFTNIEDMDIGDAVPIGAMIRLVEGFGESWTDFSTKKNNVNLKFQIYKNEPLNLWQH